MNDFTLPINKKAPRYFPKGSLVFLESGHTLTKDKNYYVCSLKQKGACSIPTERRLPSETFERNFSRWAMKFSLPEGNERFFFKEVMAKTFHAYIDVFIAGAPDESFHDGIEAAAAEQKIGNIEEFKKAVEDAKKSYMDGMKKDHGLVPFTAILMGATTCFSRNKKSEAETGRMVAFLCDKIYLANNGEVKKIKLHKMGSFVIQYIAKHKRDYLNGLKQYIDTMHVFPTLEFEQAARDIRAGALGNIFAYDPFRNWYVFSKFSSFVFQNLRIEKPLETIAQMSAFDYMMAPNVASTLNRMNLIGKTQKPMDT